MGRRWGKTILGGCVSLTTAARGGHVGWIVPTYKNGRALWRWCESAVGGLVQGGVAKVNRSERMIEFRNGGFLGIYSADNEDSVRSEAFHLVVLDEAARMSETAWTDAIQPTLADYAGDAILISTPRGRNWFWREWIGASGSYSAAFQAPTAANPNPQIQAAAARAKLKVGARTYQQEWLAQFVDDAGLVFRKVHEAATATPQDKALLAHEYVFGVDWAKSEDFTVIAVIDATIGQLVAMDRFNQVDYALQTKRLRALADAFRPQTIIAERNSIGEPLIERLQRDGLPVQPFLTTNASKANAVESLALAFEQGSLRIIDDQTLLNELQAFEMDRLPSGLMRYAAPAGAHDDCVMALMMAWQGAQAGAVEMTGENPFYA